MIDDFRPAPRRAESLQENKNNLKAEPKFVPPPEIAESDQTPEAKIVPLVPDFNAFKASAKPVGRVARLKAKWPLSKRQSLIGGGVFLLLVTFGGAAFALTRQAEPAVVTKPVVQVKKTPAPVVPTTVASNLSGLQVDPALNAKPVIGVMIENSSAARPQSGLAQAGVIYEAVAEGGITRFLALYQETDPAEIGPIRSVRPYYLHWGMGFDASIAHVGGSPEALNSIRAWGTRDMDQFAHSGAFNRVSFKQAPHNVYSSAATLTQLAQSKGYGTSTFTPWLRKKDAPAAQVSAKSIDMAISSANYNTHYDYDAPTNSYKRSLAGAPHLDATGNLQLSPKVVIGLVIPYSIQADGKHSEYGTVGSGQAYIFQDGNLIIGQWNKPDIKANLTFTDATGQPLALNAGQTWLTAITTPDKIKSAP